ncbi:prepilin-type N-terminal cleavage/methylation domain-containing protein [Vibrio metschnikovii]|uniref:prepilin-type N-terminal cleavage/methylation domain-containing protein n=1 Tax=Vibrio metschnikovii TaxID=28172 RepID=UPI001C2F4F81|nr:prepilin-type N-terminal cleavage/methylation domain-containing protein [Vibrio metschnikovii]EKO3566350.1 prepilin-type N-terminal cleavage/methylation domain-containing protein [Vibrio metschnikovii]EKO3770477.1 prepilin-type N-terminal cleavage/methylation domain-containing protein [Vibrio metschnikovii]
MPVKSINRTRGFTLVEMIIVITITAIAITGLAAALYPRSQQSAEQVIAVKAAELGRAVLDEILGRQFDRNSGPNGGLPECVLVTTPDRTPCTYPVDSAAGERDRTLFNAVDDFHGLSGLVVDVLGEDRADEYRRYQVEVRVFYVHDNSGVFSAQAATVATHYKRIKVVIIDSQGNRYPFAAIKGNY